METRYDYPSSSPRTDSSTADSTPARSNQSLSGNLGPGDAQLSTGEYKDAYQFQGSAGDRVIIEMRSTEFDPYLILRAPGGGLVAENDDFDGSSQRSRIDARLTQNGIYEVPATSFTKDERGAYRLDLPSAPAASGGQRTERGRLETGDRQLNSGEFRDEFTFEGTAGQRVVIDLQSDDFDTYLILRPPTGDQASNDDFDGNSHRSRIEITLQESGTHRILVTSFAKGETGAYVLELPAQGRDSQSNGEVTRQSGRLERGDSTLTSGEYFDVLTFPGVAGQRVVLDLRSSDFDPYLILVAPSGKQEDNDDHDGSSSWSQIAATLEETGTYTVRLSTYRAGATGVYDYLLTRRSGVAAGPQRRVETGRLASGDAVLQTGEFADSFPLAGTPGSRIVLDLTSQDFDTYLVLRSPSGESVSNDDYEESSHRSHLEHVAGEAGEYRILVTSYEKGETGNYRLAIEVGERTGTPAAPPDLMPIALGQTRRGRLENADLKRENGAFADVYAFDGVVGQTIAIEMRAAGFDTFLQVVTPDGRTIENDDFEEDLHKSRIEIPINTAGRHRIYATAYEENETGDYEVSLQRGVVAPPVIATPSNPGAGTVFGIFVGISDYGGRANNLAYTDRDPVRVQDAMVRGVGMLPANAHLLRNAEATRGRFEAALRQIAAVATPRDTLVIFFSGHGGRVPRASGPDRADPDGKDETLEFYDQALRDDDLGTLLDTVHAGIQLLVFDSCFSGGFAKDVISAPGRMGMFSSEEDVTSSVAAKFRAGGYLAQFFGDCLVEAAADEDSDGAISAIEMSHYIGEQYRVQVKSTGDDDDFIRTSLNLGYQKFVVDRGSISPYGIVFKKLVASAPR